MSEKNRGLGRGLSALLGDQDTNSPKTGAEAAEARGTEPMRGLEQPIELLVRNPDQPRRTFVESDIDELAASIREKGILQPILVRPAPGQAGHYQIVAGERRWRAAQKAGLHTVPVIIRELDDLDVLEIGIIENVQRADLNPIEEARGYKVLQDRFGRTQDALAQVVGKSRPHIANTLRLLALPEGVQDHVLHGRLSAGHARALITSENADALAEEVIAKGLSVRQTEALVREEQAGPKAAPSPKARPQQNADTLSLEQDLQEALGLNVRLDDRGGKGELRLSYASLEQLDELCRKLMK
ncbi:ParB/RepB/Spo0J family partition protein [Asticcacaulis taihuensis]|jgi:ParB family chromosome partitioning protein|uniref:Chromosome-partitioning protein ParB n=1 Tax=Asticcacaulis taihuensis TaxID=260084 RepID=A0A1G4T2Y7_9CAUL|nr:ParB/RepB/Spo0J family partition protein [Asticcacaulis taihuensis]SCW74889.1 chromosome partitioning protein, ParB family [Asticcacaulis taihuensis]